LNNYLSDVFTEPHTSVCLDTKEAKNQVFLFFPYNLRKDFSIGAQVARRASSAFKAPRLIGVLVLNVYLTATGCPPFNFKS
jgi:hypothetical protein